MSIYTKQNEYGMLLLNKTKTCLYSRAKVVSTTRTVLITLITCIFAILTFFYKNDTLSVFSIVFGILACGVSIIIDKYVNDLIWLAAGIQQKFDIYILGIDCSIPAYSLLGLDFPTREQIIKYENRYKDKIVDNILNWYNDYSNLSTANQILCCQKENFRWEIDLKKIYIIIYIFYYVFLILALIIVGVLTNNVFKMFSIYAWALPISQKAFANIRHLITDIKRLGKIKKQIDIADSLKTDEIELFNQVSNLQALIYEHRVKSTIVPDFIYKLNRKRLQSDEQAISEDINSN